VKVKANLVVASYKIDPGRIEDLQGKEEEDNFQLMRPAIDPITIPNVRYKIEVSLAVVREAILG